MLGIWRIEHPLGHTCTQRLRGLMVNNVNLWETFVILCLKAKLTWSYADGLFWFFDHSSVEIKEISFREILKDWNSKRTHCLSKKCVMNTTAHMYGETNPVWSQNLHRNIRIRKCYAELFIFYMITSSHPRVLLTIIYIEVLLDWCSVEAEIQFLCNVFYLRPTNHDILVYYEKINVKLR